MVGMVISDPSTRWGCTCSCWGGALKNVTTSFFDAIFIRLALKRSSINFTTKGKVYGCLSPVKPITNSSRLNFQIIATNYCYQLLLPIVTKARNRIVLRFGQGMEKGTGTTPHHSPICSSPPPCLKFCCVCFLLSPDTTSVSPPPSYFASASSYVLLFFLGQCKD